MARPGATQIPSFRRVSMERILTGNSPIHKTIKAVALHVGLPESVVAEHLALLRKNKSIPKDSPFYKK